MSSRATWTRATCIAVLAGFGLVAVRAADGDLPNTGMADPVALVNAFDQFAAGGAPANIVILSLANLRGVSSEAVNAGGRVQVNLATGVVTSVARLLPADGSFDLWLIDNQSGPARTTLADSSDLLMRVGTYTVLSPTARAVSATLGPAAFTGFYPDRAFVVRSGQSPVDGFVLTGPTTFFTRLRQRQVRFVDDAAAALGFDPDGRGTSRRFCESDGPRPPALSERDIRGQRTDLRDVSRRDQQLHGRSGAHCHAASDRSALRGRDQSGIGHARES